MKREFLIGKRNLVQILLSPEYDTWISPGDGTNREVNWVVHNNTCTYSSHARGYLCINLAQFSLSVMSNSLQPHGLQHARSPCPSLTPRIYPNSCPSSWWCHPTISSSIVPFFSCLQSFPASGPFPMSQLFTSGGQSTEVSASASVLPMNIQGWFPLGWTGWILTH